MFFFVSFSFLVRSRVCALPSVVVCAFFARACVCFALCAWVCVFGVCLAVFCVGFFVGCRHVTLAVACVALALHSPRNKHNARTQQQSACGCLSRAAEGKMVLCFNRDRSGVVSRLAQFLLVVLTAQSLVERLAVQAHVPVSAGEISTADLVATSRSEGLGGGSLQERRELRISTELCETVCATSQRLVGTVNLTGKLRTRNCFGEDHMESCCICLEQGFKPKTSSDSNRTTNSGGSPKPAFLHICIPTTPRILDGKDIDFLHIMLRSLEEQVLAQAASGQGFSGVSLHRSSLMD